MDRPNGEASAACDAREIKLRTQWRRCDQLTEVVVAADCLKQDLRHVLAQLAQHCGHPMRRATGAEPAGQAQSRSQ